MIDLFYWEVVILFYWVDNVGFSPGPRTLGGGDPAYAHTGQMENPENWGCATNMTGRKEWKEGGVLFIPNTSCQGPTRIPAVIPPTIVQMISICSPLSLWNDFIILVIIIIIIIIRVLHGHGGGLGRWIWKVVYWFIFRDLVSDVLSISE